MPLSHALTNLATRAAAALPWVIAPPFNPAWLLYGFRRASAGPFAYEIQKDLAYVRTPQGPQLLNLYKPLGADRAAPGVLLIHGGGWMVGSRAMHDGFGRLLASHGFIAAAADYRLLGTAPWPACLDDCQAALAWMRRNAVAIGLDPDRLALLGDSAGAHLAALLGLEGGRTTQPVRGVVCFFGPFDLTIPGIKNWPRRCQEQLLGGPLVGGQALARAEAISPARLAAPGAPPFLLIHGRIDLIVPHKSSEIMAEALAGVHARVELLTVEGADHGLFALGPIRPNLAQIDRRVVGFLQDVAGNAL